MNFFNYTIFPEPFIVDIKSELSAYASDKPCLN